MVRYIYRSSKYEEKTTEKWDLEIHALKPSVHYIQGMIHQDSTVHVLL